MEINEGEVGNFQQKERRLLKVVFKRAKRKGKEGRAGISRSAFKKKGKERELTWFWEVSARLKNLEKGVELGEERNGY